MDDTFDRIQKTVSEQIKSLESACTTLPEINAGLSAFTLVISDLEKFVPKESEAYFWICALRNQCEDMRNDIVYLAPWLELKQDSNVIKQIAPFTDMIPSLRDLADLNIQLSNSVRMDNHPDLSLSSDDGRTGCRTCLSTH